ncbi:hypothetical protein REPUB_Repub07fG0080600 [Reevesia pubescens]
MQWLSCVFGIIIIITIGFDVFLARGYSAEYLEVLWGRLTLTGEEQHEVLIEEKWFADTLKEKKNYLVGKILTTKNINGDILNSIFTKVWKIARGMSIREVGDKLFLFYFKDQVEKDGVLVNQPWSFNRSLVILKEFDGLVSVDNLNMDWCHFWIQIHGLPLG